MTQTEMRLKNVVLGVHSNSFRSIRGKTLLARSKEWDGIERLGLKMPRDLPSALAKGSEAFKRIRYSYEGNTEGVHGEFVNPRKKRSGAGNLVRCRHRATVHGDDSPAHTRRPPAGHHCKTRAPRRSTCCRGRVLVDKAPVAHQ
jgi:hypothetical protein